MDLRGRTVLITGGRRLGRRLARAVASRGAHVGLSYFRSDDVARDTVAECRAAGVAAEALEVDLRQADEAERLVDWAVHTFGAIDVLLNLTSIYGPTPLHSLTAADFDRLVHVNLSAPAYAALATARQMRRQPVIGGLQGKIVHFTDWAVDRPYRGFLPYLAAKGGLVTLTRVLAVELAPTILVNAVAPGTVEPPPDLSPDELAEIGRTSALGRVGHGQDVVAATMFLLEGTDFMTGEVLRVDGGRFLGPASDVRGDL
jgi:NAD(P)-dependent dehydrogenase (short-subunit alcohol dehydrogenase family)